jgi:hypothetical protein
MKAMTVAPPGLIGVTQSQILVRSGLPMDVADGGDEAA